jgi:hypothetical protein
MQAQLGSSARSWQRWVNFELPTGLDQCPGDVASAQQRMETLLPGHSVDSPIECPVELLWDRLPARIRSQQPESDLVRIYHGIGQARFLIGLAGSGGRANPDFQPLERLTLNRSAIVSVAAVLERMLALAVRVAAVWLNIPGGVPARWTAPEISAHVPPASASTERVRAIAVETTAGVEKAVVEALASDLYDARWLPGAQIRVGADAHDLRHTWAHGRDQKLDPIQPATIAVLIQAMERGFHLLAWSLCSQELSAACPEWMKAR